MLDESVAKRVLVLLFRRGKYRVVQFRVVHESVHELRDVFPASDSDVIYDVRTVVVGRRRGIRRVSVPPQGYLRRGTVDYEVFVFPERGSDSGVHERAVRVEQLDGVRSGEPYREARRRGTSLRLDDSVVRTVPVPVPAEDYPHREVGVRSLCRKRRVDIRTRTVQQCTEVFLSRNVSDRISRPVVPVRGVVRVSVERVFRYESHVSEVTSR